MNLNDKIEIFNVESQIKERLIYLESKAYQKDIANIFLSADYIKMKREGINLFKRIIDGRNEMHDYMTSTLIRGGYNYRQICEVFKINTITVKFYENDKIRVESPQKIVLFENQKILIYEKVSHG
ncbi:MAG TPA: hypothetical protein VL443_11380 [Cyclobacteriaceae bacterium]|jgi:hypothetical protein|nr:hypothetical protein [Cyclobacteriaceae bacterium]